MDTIKLVPLHVGGIVALGLLAFALGAIGTGLIRPALISIGTLDRPNERSSHTGPVPRGAGIVPVALILAIIAWLGNASASEPSRTALVAGAFALIPVCWLDDRIGLSPWPRLFVQAGAIAFPLALLPGSLLVFQGALPMTADRIASGLAWLWLVNAFNFMDGIDGLASVQSIAIGAGLAAVAVSAGVGWSPLVGILLAAVMLGFLPWNWPPARVFLGDVGSAPLGYIFGWLLLTLAASGAWAAALILPLYFLADATTTLFTRILRGERFWLAHREHAYQAAIRHGHGHAWVTTRVLLLDLWLIVLALASLRGGSWTGLALALALVSVAGVLWYFRRAGRHAP